MNGFKLLGGFGNGQTDERTLVFVESLSRLKSVHLWSILKLLMFAVFKYKYQSIYQQMFSFSMFLGFQMRTFFLGT